MASFNLGRIKGDKGDKGDTGAKGDKGDKGDQGERGERGSDAAVPVFSVGETLTLASSMEASVEIDAQDILNPVLHFSIPRGKDGKDASGDMSGAVYDPQGLSQDVFAYAKALFDGCVKTDGGVLSGAVTAYESPLSYACIRNIRVETSLPENAANGDLCIITEPEAGKTLGECTLGMSLLLKENGELCEYMIVGKDYHSSGSVTLIRKRLTPMKLAFDTKNRASYIMSDVDIFLETMYIRMFSERIQRKLKAVKIETDFLRRCFLLSYRELSGLEYFSRAETRIASKDSSVSKGSYITRTAPNSRTVYNVTETGIFDSVSQSTESFLRPSIVLPGNMIVENTEYESSPAVKLCDTPCGVYVFVNGVWKECAC